MMGVSFAEAVLTAWRIVTARDEALAACIEQVGRRPDRYCQAELADADHAAAEFVTALDAYTDYRIARAGVTAVKVLEIGP